MGRGVSQRVWQVLVAAGLWLQCGCFCVEHNPTYFPYLAPFYRIVPSHAKPIGRGYFANFDPHAVRLEVRPMDTTVRPVRTEYVVIATVYDEKNRPRRTRRVEWMLEGVGNIIEVDESGCLPGRGYKTDNKHGVSYTSCGTHRITRGNDNPNDDFMINPGQTWCVISSSIEGDSHVTAFAPGIANWDRSKVYVTAEWVDANWEFPPNAAVRFGSEHVMTTKIFRHTDRQPLANYRVRYTVIDGPPAVLSTSRRQGGSEIFAISDLDGLAHASIKQIQPQLGTNRVKVDIIRPPDPTAPSGAGLTLDSREITIEWLAPQIALEHTAPASVGLGQEVPVTSAVKNIGRIESRSQTVTSQIPDGFRFVRSQPPPAAQDGLTLTWIFGTLPAGQTHTVQAVYQAQRPGSVTSCASVVSEEGLKDERCTNILVTSPALKVSINAPVSGIVNVPVTYQIMVSNPGTGPVNNVRVESNFDRALEHMSKENPLQLAVGALAPNETRNLTLVLTPRVPGNLNNRITVSGDGVAPDNASHSILISEAKMSMSVDGPQSRYQGRPAEFTVRVFNSSTDVPLTNVMVRNRLPAELAFVTAGQGGQLMGSEVVWNIGTLKPQEQKLLYLTTRTQQVTPTVIQQFVATADPGVTVQAQKDLQILGIPAFRLELKDDNDPVPVGGRVTYTVNVANTGSLPANEVSLVATVPQEMRVINAQGPSAANTQGQVITFAPLNNVQKDQTLTYVIEVQALQAADVRFRVELRSQTLQPGVSEEESTKIYNPINGAPPPASPPPPSGL